MSTAGAGKRNELPKTFKRITVDQGPNKNGITVAIFHLAPLPDHFDGVGSSLGVGSGRCESGSPWHSADSGLEVTRGLARAGRSTLWVSIATGSNTHDSSHVAPAQTLSSTGPEDTDACRARAEKR